MRTRAGQKGLLGKSNKVESNLRKQVSERKREREGVLIALNMAKLT